ncbi:MAG: DUF58 domain-containing protein [Planctomycetota bacterium]
MGLALILIPAVVYWMLRRAASGLSLSQSAPKYAFEGDLVVIRVTLRNEGRRCLGNPRFSEIFTPEDGAQKDIVFPQRIYAGEQIERQYEARCLSPRGRYRYGPSVLRISDPFGWFEIQARLETFTTIIIYPSLVNFGLDQQRAGSARHAVSEILRAGPGESSDFWSLRDYRPGDSPRRIHWPTSARRGDLVVREMARPSSGDLTIFLDTHRSVTGQRIRYGQFENAIRLTASLVATALRTARRVEVYSQSGRIGPSAQTSHAKLREWLDAFVPLEPSAPTRLSAAIGELLAGRHDGSLTVVMIHQDSMADEATIPTLASLTQRGQQVIAVVFEGRSEKAILTAARFTTGARRRGIGVYRISAGKLDHDELEVAV